MSPLENAIETMETTNQKLQVQIDLHRTDPKARIDPLGMLLNGVVDAAVSGGIANYKVRVDSLYAEWVWRNSDMYLLMFLCDGSSQSISRYSIDPVYIEYSIDKHRKG